MARKKVSIGRKKASKLLEELREVRKTATMESASFGFDKALDAIIKEKTRLWRETWIIAPLDRAIRLLEEELGEASE
jgi:hypothetical protein